MRKKDIDNLQEEWLPIKGYEQYYEVSNMGNVRRTKSKRLRSISHTKLYSHFQKKENTKP